LASGDVQGPSVITCSVPEVRRIARGLIDPEHLMRRKLFARRIPMIGRFLDRLLEAQAGWARPFGDWLHDLMAAIFGRMLRVRDLIAGT
jgi:hypothetical protein